MTAPPAQSSSTPAPLAMAAPQSAGRIAALSLAVALAYLVSNKAALVLFPFGKEMTLLSPAAGVAVAALLIWGVRLLPAIFVAAVLAELAAGVSLGSALLSSVLAGVYFAVVLFLLDRVVPIDRGLRRMTDVLAFVILGVGALVLLHATGHYVMLALMPSAPPPGAIPPSWASALAIGVSVLLVAPPILTWHASRDAPIPRSRRLEAVCLAAATLATAVVVFYDYFMPMIGVMEMPYALFPLVFWATLRFGPREGSLAVLAAALIALWFTSHGQGPYAARNPAEGAVALYLFLTVLATTGLLFAAVFSQRTQADRLVRKSEQQYRVLVESMNEGLAMHDQDGRLTYVSERFCELSGYPREALIGRLGRDIVAPEDQARWTEWHRLRRLGSRQAFELTIVRQNGERLPVQVSPRPLFDDQGGYVGGLALVSDITERRRAERALRDSEEKYRLIVETQRDLVLRIARDGRTTFVSPSYRLMFGRDASEALGKPLALDVHEEDRAATDQAWQSVWRGPRFASFENRVMTPDGWRWLAWSVHAVVDRDAGDEAASLIAVARDVTARRRAEEQARQHLQQLAHVSRVSSMGEMASAIAHEINQPLTAIANYAYACLRLLRADRSKQDEALQAMQRVAAEAERAGEVVRKLRSFVRGEEGELAAVDANALVGEVLRLAAPEARQSGVELVAALAAALPPVFADSIQIQQVLLNLVRNAVEAINAHEADEREVRIATRLADGGRVEITVLDTGPGLAPDALEKVFEPFYTTKPDGVGIGLALSRSIVDAHGGRLWASAGPSRGAAFHLTLPVAAAQEIEHG